MTIRTKKIIGFIITILLATGVYVWSYPLNKGSLSITADNTGYSVTSGKITTQCAQNTCTIKLKAGINNITITKNKYFTETINVFIRRGKTSSVTVKLKKIPSLTISQSAPKNETKTQKLPSELDQSQISASTFDESGALLAYLDKKDNKLKIWDNKNASQIITILNNVGVNFTLYWSPDQKYLFGSDDKDIYFIDIKKASRKKEILSFTPSNITWSLNSDYLVLNDDKYNLYKIDFAAKKTDQLKTVVNLKNSVWNKDGELVYFTYDTTSKTSKIESFDPVNLKSRLILTEYSFQISEAVLDDKKELNFYNPDKKAWYKLDY